MAIILKDYEPVKIGGVRVPHLKRHRQDKSRFLFDFTKNKKRYRHTYTAPKDTPANMAKMAKARCEEYYAHAGRIRDDLRPDILLDDYWERYCRLKEPAWSSNHKRTLKGYYSNHIAPHIGQKQVRRITEAEIEDVVNGVSGISRRSQKVILEILKPLFSRAIKEGVVTESPVKIEIRRNAAEEKKIVLGAEEKFKRLHKAINDLYRDNPKVRAAFLFGLNGRRLSEVLTLRWSDIDLQNATYVVRKENSKVKADMTFSLNGELIEAIKELEARRDSEWVFSSNRDPAKRMVRLSQYYEEVGEKSGIEGFHFHLMRNILVSALAGKDGVDVADLSSLLGHTDTNTLRKYLSLQREQASRKASEAITRMLR